MDPRHWVEVRAWSQGFRVAPQNRRRGNPAEERGQLLPIYSDQFWTKWFPRARSGDLARFLALARRGRPYDNPHLAADLPEVRERYMEGLKIQQLEHMRVSLDYCRNTLNLGFAGADESVAGLAGSTQLDFPVPVILP